MAKLFLSYRREDTKDVVVPLAERLSQAFGHYSVFLDEDVIEPGSGFAGALGGGIYTANVILVVIGPRWLDVKDSRGRRRIDDKDDYVRMEVGLALASRRPTIPLCVEGASLPAKRELPRDIRALASLSAMSLRRDPASFERDVSTLIERLGGPVPDATPARATRRPRRNMTWTSFEGLWQGADGSTNEILHQGDEIEINGRSPSGVELHGSGRIEGSRAHLRCTNSLGVSGDLVIELTPDGAYLHGRWSDVRGMMPVQMMRRG